jgi:hypothetical protein
MPIGFEIIKTRCPKTSGNAHNFCFLFRWILHQNALFHFNDSSIFQTEKNGAMTIKHPSPKCDGNTLLLYIQGLELTILIVNCLELACCKSFLSDTLFRIRNNELNTIVRLSSKCDGNTLFIDICDS